MPGEENKNRNVLCAHHCFRQEKTVWMNFTIGLLRVLLPGLPRKGEEQLNTQAEKQKDSYGERGVTLRLRAYPRNKLPCMYTHLRVLNLSTGHPNEV